MAAATASGQTQLKRKSSVAGLASGGIRTVKRRASKACQCCRSRKVRCDVVESGIPCTNCRLDEVECLVTEGKRRRKSYADGEIFIPSPQNSVQEEKDLPQFPIFDDIDGLQDLPLSLDAMPTHPTLNTLDHELSYHKPHMLYQTQGHRLSMEERARRLSVISNAVPALQSPAHTSQAMPYFAQHSQRPEIVLPPYISGIPPRIMKEDLEYLQKKGAFFIPETGLRNELLRNYAKFVHPYLPLIDLQDFLTVIEKNDAADTVSLLLFQAVMFAATAYIDMRFLAAQGYDTRKAARKAFFQRVKMLYDFDFEVDRVTVVQAVLLMTYWYENPDDPKDVWHWLGIAISLARTIGLNCDTSDAPMSVKKQRLWKRVWWSCFIRDRLVAIGMRRPMRINKDDFDVQMLRLEDFETEAMPAEISRMLGGCPAVKDSSKRVTLAKMCIGLIKLCACISSVLAVQYSILSHKIGATQETTMRLVPKKAAADPSDVIRCDRELDQWHKELPPELRYFASASHERTMTNDGEVINVHRSLLAGVYLTAVSALHRPQIMPSMPNLVIAPELQELSKRKVREAANDITEIFRDLFAHDLIRYLPNTGVTILLPAIIIHLLDIKSNDSNVRHASLRRFQFCMQALQRLREMYASADFAFSFLDAAVRKADVQFASPASTAPSVRPRVLDNIKLDQARLMQAPVTLTPPPEALKAANQLLFTSTLAPEERQLLEAMTPPGSDTSLNSVMTGGAAVALSDIEDQAGHTFNDSIDAEMVQNDFDALINLEGGGDLYGGEDGICADLNMQWLDNLDTEGEAPVNGMGKGVNMETHPAGCEGNVHLLTGDLDTDLDVAQDP